MHHCSFKLHCFFTITFIFHSHHHHLFTAALFPRPRVSSPSATPFSHNLTGDGRPSTSAVKRKRPTMLDIPVMPLGFEAQSTPGPAQDGVMEEERDGFYSVYCKKGRRAAMEDRFSTALDFQGDPKKGGYVDCYNGVWRIQGSLAVWRAIGDSNLKQWVIAEPETKVILIKPDDEFLILASGGLWDKVSNQEAVDIARPLCTCGNKLQMIAACKNLVDMSVSRGSLDDVSVMVIQLERYMI